VLATFTGVGLVQTDPPRTADNIRASQLANLGRISIVEKNASQYFDRLLKSPWYFICVKRDIDVPARFVRIHDNGEESIPDANLIEFLREEEHHERGRIEAWIKQRGRGDGGIRLGQPWAIAREALARRDRAGSAGHDLKSRGGGR
jgi:hypothetical protein